MSGIEITTLAFRLAALFVGFRTILQIAYLPMMVTTTSAGDLGRASLIGYAAAIGLGALLGILLWFASPFLARRLGATGEGETRRGAEIGGLALRLAGIWLIDRALQEVWNVVFQAEAWSATVNRGRLILSVVVLLLFATLGAGLLLRGRALAGRLFRSADPAPPLASELQAAAFSVLGLVIVVRALPAVLSGFAFPEDLIVREPSWPVIVVSLLQLALGLALFLGGGLLSRVWRWAQTAGLGRVPNGTGKSTEAPHA